MRLYLAVSVVVLAAWLAYEFNDVYVPEGFEKPTAFRAFAVFVRSVNYFGKAASWLKLGSFSSSFRAMTQYLDNLAETPDDKNFRIQKATIADVPVMIYTNVQSTTKSAPLLIYYHGGGFTIGSSRAYEKFFHELSKNVDLKIISVEYRLAPEYAYPIPIEDCYQVTKHIFENSKEYEIDVNRVALGGDSAGGNIVTVLSQRMVTDKLPFAPKLQVMIYPWLQMWTNRLPSVQKYQGRVSAFKFASLYMGFDSEHDHNVGEILASNNHTTLVNNRQKLLSYLDLNNIPDKYKSGREYYQNFVQLGEIKVEGGVEASEEVKEKLKRLADPGMSPLFAEESTLSQLPKAYMIVLEWDVLKDEGILYSERLRKAGVDTTVAFYENAFHGIFTQSSLFSIASVIQADLIKFIKFNL